MYLLESIVWENVVYFITCRKVNFNVTSILLVLVFIAFEEQCLTQRLCKLLGTIFNFLCLYYCE